MKRLLALLLAAILTLSCCSVVLAEEAAAQDVVTVELALAAKVDHGDWNDFWCLDLIEKECGIRFHVPSTARTPGLKRRAPCSRWIPIPRCSSTT